MNIAVETREHETKCRIVAAAELLFKQFGYQKTTVADIAKKLGMSSANVYRYFDSKKAINESVALGLTGEVEHACAEIAAEEVSAADRLRKILQTIHAMNQVRFVQNEQMHEMVAAAMRDSWPIIQQHILNVDEVIAGVLRQGMASGEFRRVDPHVAARCVSTSMMRFFRPGLMIECQNMALPTFEHMTEFVLMALKSHD